jgi:hypothetical protein
VSKQTKSIFQYGVNLIQEDITPKSRMGDESPLVQPAGSPTTKGFDCNTQSLPFPLTTMIDRIGDAAIITQDLTRYISILKQNPTVDKKKVRALQNDIVTIIKSVKSIADHLDSMSM